MIPGALSAVKRIEIFTAVFLSVTTVAVSVLDFLIYSETFKNIEGGILGWTGNLTLPLLLLLCNLMYFFILERRKAARRIHQAESGTRVHQLAIRDPATGFFNRRHFYEQLSIEHARSVRHGRAMSVLIASFDDLKRVEQLHGSVHADQTLRRLGQLLKENLRETDIFARYTSDQFIVLLPETAQPGAVRVAQKLRDELARVVKTENGYSRATVSIGVAGLEPTMKSEHELVDSAAEALHDARSHGANNVSWPHDGDTEPAPLALTS
ncbi:MAG: diguanylate cyclase [Dehalococcoidia bacterium]|nr:diguanylate cyclase [Dehalococcoidia bacterium]